VAAVVTWARHCLPAWLTGGALAAVFVFAVMPHLAPLFWPMRHFYDLRSVMVSNAPEGTSPHMLVDRTIKRDFRGRYEVEILRAEGSEMVLYWGCGVHASSERTYRVIAALPDPLTLDWWLDIPPNRECLLPPGQYRIITTVYAETPFGAEVSVERPSNLFTVYGSKP
jgi:hypothetical protein